MTVATVQVNHKSSLSDFVLRVIRQIQDHLITESFISVQNTVIQRKIAKDTLLPDTSSLPDTKRPDNISKALTEQRQGHCVKYHITL